MDALLTADSLQGLPPVFNALGLMRDEKGKPVFRLEAGPLAEVLGRIRAQADYGQTASGRLIADEFAKEPFGWDFDVVRLLVLALLRAGAIEATSKGQTIDVATSGEARDTFSNNNVFRSAAFRPRKEADFEQLVKAAEAFRDTFGSEVRELAAGAIVAELRQEVARHEDAVASAARQIATHRLPGGQMLEDALDQLKAIQRGSEENAIATFNASHGAIKDAIKRASELAQCLTEPRLRDIERARQALRTAWPFLREEGDVPYELRDKAAKLEDVLQRETFYRELATIDELAGAIDTEYRRRYDEALEARVDAYTAALGQLTKTGGWTDLGDDQRDRIAAQLKAGSESNGVVYPIPQLRAEREVCAERLRAAVKEVHRVVEGERLVMVSLDSYFAGGIDTEEQLEAALAGIREECARLIGAGKKVIVQ